MVHHRYNYYIIGDHLCTLSVVITLLAIIIVTTSDRCLTVIYVYSITRDAVHKEAFSAIHRRFRNETRYTVLLLLWYADKVFQEAALK